MIASETETFKTIIYHLKRAFLNTVVAHYLLPKRLRNKAMRRLGIPVGAGTNIFSGLLLRSPRVSIGANVFINHHCQIIGGGALIVEDDVGIGPGVTFITESHEVGQSWRRMGRPISIEIRVGRGSWIGANATILPGCNIAPGCVVGTNATVTRATEPDGLYVGIPARRVRDLADSAAAT